MKFRRWRNFVNSREGRVRSKSLAFKLAFFILTCSSLIFGAVLGYNYYVSRQLILQNIEASARDLAATTAQKIETVLRSIEEVPETVAESLAEITYDEKTLKQLLLRSSIIIPKFSVQPSRLNRMLLTAAHIIMLRMCTARDAISN